MKKLRKLKELVIDEYVLYFIKFYESLMLFV